MEKILSRANRMNFLRDGYNDFECKEDEHVELKRLLWNQNTQAGPCRYPTGTEG